MRGVREKSHHWEKGDYWGLVMLANSLPTLRLLAKEEGVKGILLSEGMFQPWKNVIIDGARQNFFVPGF